MYLFTYMWGVYVCVCDVCMGTCAYISWRSEEGVYCSALFLFALFHWNRIAHENWS